MKMRYLLLLLACCALCVASATAFTVQTPTGIPSGDLTPGTRLNIETTVSFATGTTGSTFPGGDTLQFYTDLETARWNIAIVLNSVENPRPLETGRTVRISGFELEYPSGMDLKVRVTLEGVVPTVSATGDKAVLRIRQLDSSDNVRSGGEYIVTKTVINPAEVQTSIIAAKADLQTFKAEIEAAKADGVDTTAVDAKFNSAELSLQSAEGAGSNVGSAQSFLNTARTAITDGRKLLEESVVQHAINTANGVLSEIDSVLDYFTTNRSMGSDSRVVLIASKRQSVKNQIDTAKGNFDIKNYALAERQANDALREGRSVLIEAQNLKEEVESIPVIIDPGKPFLYVILGVIVIIIVGFVVIKRKRSWDELG
ncbi:MAG: hypothetical protein Q7J09_11310 [Methanocalculus sp.]|uniref:hypothetical protein n=1 Tax=Methanocalculus sp. TaxID=2004547 RepID=UPI00271A23F0|nr:hypothetical protein [Methanocalculus sp.]MDO9540571.1 hypothetical protein [Methanocalculus sp.]